MHTYTLLIYFIHWFVTWNFVCRVLVVLAPWEFLFNFGIFVPRSLHFWKGEWQFFCPWKSFHILQRLNVFKSGVMSRVLARKLSSFSLFTCAGLPRDTG